MLIVRRKRIKKKVFWLCYPVTMMNQIYKPINFLFESYLYANSTSCNQIDGGDKSVNQHQVSSDHHMFKQTF